MGSGFSMRSFDNSKTGSNPIVDANNFYHLRSESARSLANIVQSHRHRPRQSHILQTDGTTLPAAAAGALG